MEHFGRHLVAASIGVITGVSDVIGLWKLSGAGPGRAAHIIRMNHSLLRLYALLVCVVTALSVLLIAAIPLWRAAMASATEIEQHQVYQFVTEGTVACTDCTAPVPSLELSTRATAAIISPYHTPEADTAADTTNDVSWIPPWVFTALRILIAVVGMLIFAVHWRLYRNLGFVR